MSPLSRKTWWTAFSFCSDCTRSPGWMSQMAYYISFVTVIENVPGNLRVLWTYRANATFNSEKIFLRQCLSNNHCLIEKNSRLFQRAFKRDGCFHILLFYHRYLNLEGNIYPWHLKHDRQGWVASKLHGYHTHRRHEPGCRLTWVFWWLWLGFLAYRHMSARIVNLDCKLLWDIESPWKQTSGLDCGGLARLGD